MLQCYILLSDAFSQEKMCEYLQRVWKEKIRRANERPSERQPSEHELRIEAQKEMVRVEARAKLHAEYKAGNRDAVDPFHTMIVDLDVATSLTRASFPWLPDSAFPKPHEPSFPQPHERTVPYFFELLFRNDDRGLQDNPGGKKSRSKGKHRVEPYPCSGHAKKVTFENESASDDEVQEDATRAKNKDVVRETQPEVQSSTSMHENVVVQGANVQASTPVTDAVVGAANAQLPPSSPEDVSTRSVRFLSPSRRDVSVESVNVQSSSSLLVDVSAQSVEDVTLSSISGGAPPHTQNDCFNVAPGPMSSCGQSSLRVGYVKSSRKHIPPPTARSKAKSPAEDDGFMLDRDQERAMLEEAAKNAPVFNLPANLSFTRNVSHFTTKNFLWLISGLRCSRSNPMPRLPKSPTLDHLHLKYRLPHNRDQRVPVSPIFSPTPKLSRNLLRPHFLRSLTLRQLTFRKEALPPRQFLRLFMLLHQCPLLV